MNRYTNTFKCPKCGKEYGFEIGPEVCPGGKTKETGYCPHYGAEGPSAMTSQLRIPTFVLNENDKPVEPDWKQVEKDVSELKNKC